jgi:hypothetical protein
VLEQDAVDNLLQHPHLVVVQPVDGLQAQADALAARAALGVVKE